MCGCIIIFKIELNESIIQQIIDKAFISYILTVISL